MRRYLDSAERSNRRITKAIWPAARRNLPQWARFLMSEEQAPKVKMSFDLGPLEEKASRIKLPGGVVGKLSLTIVIASIALGAIGWAASSFNVWISAFCAAMVGAIVLILGWRLI